MKKPKSREVRLGIVMYGGVSLAVYTNGVAHELFRAVRGRGIYRLIKAITDSDVVVDVVSGTSAGGINGILLAFALCNDREIAQTASLWREHGDFGRLLRDPSKSVLTTDSLLNSEGYYVPQLERALREMATRAVEGGIEEDPSRTSELDLFVTGTDFHGRTLLSYDHSGHTIFTKDHRTVFRLKHRPGRKEPLHPRAFADGKVPAGAVDDATAKRNADACFGALAKLAQITSCFPGAFSPVLVAKGSGDVDDRLVLWGALEQDAVLIDGGVLDNKPFTSTLDAIFYRTAQRPVQRYLMYIEPDPEQEPKKKKAAPDAKREPPQAPVRPGIVRTVLDAMGRIPGYESIAGDLRRLNEHNDKLQRFLELRKNVADRPERSPLRAEPLGSTVYFRARLMAMSDAVLAAVFPATPNTYERPELLARLGKLRRALVEHSNAPEILNQFDIDFRLRRLMAMSYLMDERAVPTSYLEQLNWLIEALQITRSTMETALGTLEPSVDLDPADFWDQVAAVLSDLLRVEARDAMRISEAPNDQLTALGRELGARCQRLRARAADGPRAFGDKAPLLQELDDVAAELHQRHGLSADYYGFEAIDRELFPLEHVSGLHERDIIRTIRISPIDATLGFGKGKDIEDKVCGIQAGHFGAFLKKSWRSNDVLWGRLDGVTRIVATLLEREAVATALASMTQRELAELTQRVVAGGDLDPAKLFPNSAHRADALREFFVALLDPERRAGALAALPRQDGVHSELPQGGPFELLVEAEQLEILSRDLISVTQDAVDEQLEWNIYRLAKEAPSAELSVEMTGNFKSGGGELDSLTAVLASARLAEQAAAELASKPQGLSGFFSTRYRVGRERLATDVPRLVLLELVSRALLVAKNALLHSLGDRADDVRTNKLFRVFVDWPLRLFAQLTSFLRRAPDTERTIGLASLAYCVLAGAALLLSSFTIVYDKSTLNVAGTIVFVVVPVVLLVVALALLEAPERSAALKRAGSIFRRLGGALLAVLGLGMLGATLFGDTGPSCAVPSFPWTWLCKIPGVGANPVIPKLILLALPFVGGWLVAKKTQPPPAEEREVGQLLSAMSRDQLARVWQQLEQAKEPRGRLRMAVAPRLRLLAWARKHKKVAELARLAKLELKSAAGASPK